MITKVSKLVVLVTLATGGLSDPCVVTHGTLGLRLAVAATRWGGGSRGGRQTGPTAPARQ